MSDRLYSMQMYRSNHNHAETYMDSCLWIDRFKSIILKPALPIRLFAVYFEPCKSQYQTFPQNE